MRPQDWILWCLNIDEVSVNFPEAIRWLKRLGRIVISALFLLLIGFSLVTVLKPGVWLLVYIAFASVVWMFATVTSLNRWLDQDLDEMYPLTNKGKRSG